MRGKRSYVSTNSPGDWDATFQPSRGLWINADNVAALYYLEPSLPDPEPGWLSKFGHKTAGRNAE